MAVANRALRGNSVLASRLGSPVVAAVRVIRRRLACCIASNYQTNPQAPLRTFCISTYCILLLVTRADA